MILDMFVELYLYSICFLCSFKIEIIYLFFKHMIHDAAFKARTKNRKRMRDIKAVVATGE